MKENLPAMVTEVRPRPIRRRTHREQYARITWRWACYTVMALAVFYSILAVAVMVAWQDDEMLLMSAIAAYTAANILHHANDVPRWWYKFNP